VLRVGRNEFPLVLLNTSATGFSALSPVLVDVQVGDRLRLQTVTGWMEVRVARLDSQDQATNLGLERLREIGDHLPFDLLDFIGGPRVAAALVIALFSGALIGGVLVVVTYW
jgi:hypothetical protein